MSAGKARVEAHERWQGEGRTHVHLQGEENPCLPNIKVASTVDPDSDLLGKNTDHTTGYRLSLI